jgi:L-lysine 2,3-aminomutase
MKNINNDPDVWATMWQQQVEMGLVPYYMFIARNTGAQHYFSISLEEAWKIFRKAYRQVSGLARTVRGPVMSCYPGKIQVLGVSEIMNEKVFTLRALQHRDPKHVMKPFFAKYDPEAIWYDELKPAFGEEKFFFE